MAVQKSISFAWMLLALGLTGSQLFADSDQETSPATSAKVGAVGDATPDTKTPEGQRASEVVNDEEPIAADVMIRGTVFDTDGATVSGAEVLVFAHTPTRKGAGYEREPIARSATGPDGAFQVRIRQGSFAVTARAEGQLAYHAYGGQTGDREVIDGMDVSLKPIARATGRVLDPNGRPVKGQLVRFKRSYGYSAHHATDYEGINLRARGRSNVTTDEDGRFEVTSPAGIDYWVDVSSRFAKYSESHSVTEGAEILVRLDAGKVATGRVFLADGRPAVGAHVWFHSYPTRRTTTDASGRFEIMGTRRLDNSYITVRHKDAAVFCLQPLPKDASDLVVKLEQGRTIEGRVVDGDGNGIDGALIRAVGKRVIVHIASHVGMHAPDYTWEWANDRSERVTDREGRFQFTNLYSGSFQLKAALEDFSIGAVTTTARTGDGDVEIELSPATMRKAALQLLVLGRQAGEPVPHAKVRIWPERGGQVRNLITDDSGHVQAVGFEPGAYSINIDHAGFARGREPIKLRLGDNKIQIELSPAVDVELWIRTPDGELIEDTYVELKRANGELFQYPLGQGSMATRKQLRDGVVKLQRAPSEMLTLRVERQHGDFVEQPLDLRVESGSVLDVVVVWDPPTPTVNFMIIAIGAIIILGSGWILMKRRKP